MILTKHTSWSWSRSGCNINNKQYFLVICILFYFIVLLFVFIVFFCVYKQFLKEKREQQNRRIWMQANCKTINRLTFPQRTTFLMVQTIETNYTITYPSSCLIHKQEKKFWPFCFTKKALTPYSFPNNEEVTVRTNRILKLFT